MTTQLTASEKLQFVEDKIRGLVPRLKELSFGCRVKMKEGENWCWNGGVINKATILSSDGKWAELFIGNHQIDHAQGSFHKNQFDVIGHPITLEDVLEAIDPWGNWGVVAGHIARIDRKKSEYSMKVKWQYGKPLSEQSEELIDFLCDLLK